MSTKSLKKELMAAIVMLLVAAIALSGSTFAWFAQNGKVKAENMQVTVASDMGFLLITNSAVGTTEAEIDKIQKGDLGGNKTAADAVVTKAALYPTIPTYTAIGTYADPTTKGAAETQTIWKFRYSTDAGVSTGITDWETVSGEAFTKYVLMNEFSVSVAEGSATMEALTLTVTPTLAATTMTNTAVKVLVVTTEKDSTDVKSYAVFTSTGAIDTKYANKGTTYSAVGLTDKDALDLGDITETTRINIAVYIFWDGDEASVFSNNIPNLNETKVLVEVVGNPVEGIE